MSAEVPTATRARMRMSGDIVCNLSVLPTCYMQESEYANGILISAFTSCRMAYIYEMEILAIAG